MLQETLEYLGIAFVCSVLLIIISKIILQALIRRPADYYNAEELREEELMLNAGGISITSEHETNPAGEIIEESHLEARLGDSEPAEPEKIIAEIPESVHQSIEITDDETETFDETETYTEEYEPESADSAEPDVTEDTSSENNQTTEEQFGFSIKAKASRTRKPKIREEEDAAEEFEQVKAVIDEAKAHEGEAEPVREWPESYADIRKSLEKAFTEKSSASADSSDAAKGRKKGRRRAPSMNMNRKDLIEIALSRGIEVPEDATKRQILDLIYSDRRNRY